MEQEFNELHDHVISLEMLVEDLILIIKSYLPESKEELTDLINTYEKTREI